jgi:hypothetical protein
VLITHCDAPTFTCRGYAKVAPEKLTTQGLPHVYTLRDSGTYVCLFAKGVVRTAWFKGRTQHTSTASAHSVRYFKRSRAGGREN